MRMYVENEGGHGKKKAASIIKKKEEIIKEKESCASTTTLTSVKKKKMINIFVLCLKYNKIDEQIFHFFLILFLYILLSD